jgi:methyl-accepting chemotaxis protein
MSPSLRPIVNNGRIGSASVQLYQGKSQPLGLQGQVDKALDVTQYSQMHGQVHPKVRDYLQRFGYYDIFLVQLETGRVVYTVFKELDFATSLVDGPYADTGLGEAFRLAQAASDPNFVAFTDFKPYYPPYEAPAGFVASPIFAGEQKVGILIFQFPLDTLNGIMKERTGMGKTGETYLVGSEMLMRSDSFLDSENHSVIASFRHPDKGKVDTDASRTALEGDTGEKIVTDYNGNPVLSAYTPMTFDVLHWRCWPKSTRPKPLHRSVNCIGRPGSWAFSVSRPWKRSTSPRAPAGR